MALEAWSMYDSEDLEDGNEVKWSSGIVPNGWASLLSICGQSCANQ